MNLLKWNRIEEMTTKEYCDYLKRYCMEYKNCLSDMVSVANWRTGHAESLHVNMSMDALFKRGVCENKIATSYPDKETLNEVLASSFLEYGEEIAKAILTEGNGNNPKCTMRLKYDYPIGYGIDEVFEALEVEASNTVIIKNRSADLGFMVITSFPDVQTKCGSYYNYSYLNDAKNLGVVSKKDYIERKLHNTGYDIIPNKNKNEVSCCYQCKNGDNIRFDQNIITKEVSLFFNESRVSEQELTSHLSKNDLRSFNDIPEITEDAIDNFKFPTIEEKPNFTLLTKNIKLPDTMDGIVKVGFEIE